MHAKNLNLSNERKNTSGITSQLSQITLRGNLVGEATQQKCTTKC